METSFSTRANKPYHIEICFDDGRSTETRDPHWVCVEAFLRSAMVPFSAEDVAALRAQLQDRETELREIRKELREERLKSLALAESALTGR